jgi:AsmA protein
LLDAMKDRKTRDAVRSAIERYTGQKVAPEAAVPAPASAPTAAEAPKGN